ncbi:MAG: T9SS type A sorting domain-containing protein, partial [Candidatus Fermentibacteraceae bacterium]|nr:T9SS type A sorting domain-containing protein [Candidatus Fermentibacteraceae bacterium]
MKTLLCFMLLIAGAAMATGLTIVESSTDGLVFELTASQPEFKTLSIRGNNYSHIAMEGTESISDFSMPRVPVYRTWLEIPIGATVGISISDETVLSMDAPDWPIQPGIMSASKNDPRDSFTMEFDEGIYSRGTAFPNTWVRVVYAGQMRGRNLALVEVLPLRWNPADNSCDLLSEATITLSYEGGDLGATFASAARYYAPPFERMLSSLTSNYGTFEGGCDTPPAPYLIVGHEDFVTTGMDDFVAWKESLGFDVTMVDLSVTGTSYADIEAYILDAIENWADPPQYVLLVGDTPYLPGNAATKYSGVTDLYYVSLPDGGYLPDAFIGRFSVTSVGQAVLMADRVIDYEQNVSGVTPWVQNTCWIASVDNSGVSEGTHNYCIENFLDPLNYTYDKVYPATYSSDASDAIASINGGISMLTFSGHGSNTSWGDMSFNSGDFANLTNSTMLPGVLSHSCNTGNFATGTAWCETWTRTPGKGGLWFFGSVPSSYWDEDDIQERVEYEWFLGDGITWAKGFCNGGLLGVFNYYSGGGSSQYYFEGYNLMGDPSVQMAVWGGTGIGDQSGGDVSVNTNILVANPVRSSAVVTLNASGPARLHIFDLTGRLVATPYEGDISGSESFSWNTSELTPGMYFLRLVQGDEV